MVSLEDLKNVLHDKQLEMKEKALLCLAGCSKRVASISEIREVGINAGMRESKSCNFSLYLGRSNGEAIRTGHGWELTDAGLTKVNDILGIAGRVTLATVTVRALREHASKLSNPDTKAFVTEAIECVGQRLYRAAVVLSWVGALSILHNYVASHCLSAFNAEAKRIDNRRKESKNADDLGKFKEYDFLQIIEHISVIGKNVKSELEDCLRLRNSCGHPNSLKLGEATVAAHIEMLILNVFEKF